MAGNSGSPNSPPAYQGYPNNPYQNFNKSTSNMSISSNLNTPKLPNQDGQSIHQNMLTDNQREKTIEEMKHESILYRLQQLRKAADDRINHGHARVHLTAYDMQILSEFEDLMQVWWEIEFDVDAYETILRQQLLQRSYPHVPAYSIHFTPTPSDPTYPRFRSAAQRLLQFRQVANHAMSVGGDRPTFPAADLDSIMDFEALLETWRGVETKLDAYEADYRG